MKIIQNSDLKCKICLLFIACASCVTVLCQPWEVELLQDINPTQPDAFVWEGFSKTTYPVSVAIPVSMFIYGKIQKDKVAERSAYEVAGSILIAGVAAGGTKIILDRMRPYEKYNTIYSEATDQGRSFPSAHTAIAFATATSVSIQYKKWYVVLPAYLWASGVGYSRMYLGEHYPSDVLGGAAIGVGSAVLSHVISNKIFRTHQK